MGVIVSAGNSPHNILSGHTESDDVVVSGGSMFVLAGGKADATTVSSGGVLTIDLGGIGSGSVLAGGGELVSGTEIGATIKSGTQDVDLGGTATHTTISGGLQDVFVGGIASITTIKNHGQQSDFGVAITTIVGSGGAQDIRSGGTATATTIDSGGFLVVESDGKATGAAISGGSQGVLSAGTATGTTIRTGSETVAAGGTDLGAKIFGGKQDVFGYASGATVFGGSQVVESGGTTRAATVSNGGALELLGGAVASGLAVKAGGTLNILHGYVLNFFNLTGGTLDVRFGGTDANGGVGAGGKVVILDGGRDLGLNVSAGGKDIVSALGADSGTTVLGGGEAIVAAGGTGVGDTVMSGGTALVQSGGHVSTSFMASGGVEIVQKGAVASAGEVGSGGTLKDFGLAKSTTVDGLGAESVGSGGTDQSTSVDGGGKLTVLSDGTAIDTTVASGGTANVMAGGTLSVDAGGTSKISGSLVNSGSVILANLATLSVGGTVANAGKLFANGNGSLIDITGVVSGGVTVIGNGTVEIAGSSSENVSFLSTGVGGLKLDGLGSAYAGKITGFGGVHHGNADQFIDFASINLAGATVSFTSAASHTSGTLTVTDGVHSASVVLIGQYVTSDFQKLNDGSGHLKITDPVTLFTGPLFVSGTETLTASAGGDIIAESTVHVAGALNATTGGHVEVEGAALVSGGFLFAVHGGEINLDSTLSSVVGDIEASALGALTVQGLVTNKESLIEANGGTVDLESGVINQPVGGFNNAFILADQGGVLLMRQNLINSDTVAADHDSFMQIGSTNSGTVIINEAIISAAHESTIVMAAGSGALAGILNLGLIDAESSAGISVQGGLLLNQGTVEANAAIFSVASGATVSNMGMLEAGSGGTLQLNGAVLNPGVLEVTGNGAILANSVTGGVAELNGSGGVNDATGALNGPIDTIQLGNSDTSVNFAVGVNTHGLLVLSADNQANPMAYSGLINGFTQFDGIDLSDIAFVAGDKVVFNSNPGGVGGGVLNVETTSGTVLAQINLAGFDPNPPSLGSPAPYSTLNFNINPDTNGDIIITDPPVTQQQPGNAPAAVGDGEVLEINTPDLGNVTFTGTTGLLGLDQPATFTGAVAGFGAQNGIDLLSIASGASTTLAYGPNAGGTGGTLSLSDGAYAARIALLGSYMASSFATAADGHGGTLVTTAQAADQPLLTTPRA